MTQFALRVQQIPPQGTTSSNRHQASIGDVNYTIKCLNLVEARVTDIEDGVTPLAQHITDTTQSASVATGALVVDGGVGIAKALYVGNSITSAENLTYNKILTEGLNTEITAFPTGGQLSATELTKSINFIGICGTAGDSVKLLSPSVGLKQVVKNNGIATLNIFPPTGVIIDKLSVNEPIGIQPGSSITFYGKSTIAYESSNVAIPSVRVSRVTSAQGTVTTGTVLQWNSVIYELGGELADLATNSTRITAPIAGVYMISCGCRIENDADGRLSLRLNGATPIQDEQVSGFWTGGASVHSQYRLAAGDYIEAIAYPAVNANTIQDQVHYLAMVLIARA